MSKAVKEFMMQDYRDRLGDLEDAIVVSLRGIDANSNNAIRNGLRKKDIHVSVVRNKLFAQTFADTKLGELSPVLTGANALAYGAESVVEVAREFVDLMKEFPDIELKGAVLDGELYAGSDGVERLSKFPTRDEAIAEDVTLVLGPGRKLMGALKGPGGNLAGVIKAIQDKLEAGETISKA